MDGVLCITFLVLLSGNIVGSSSFNATEYSVMFELLPLPWLDWIISGGDCCQVCCETRRSHVTDDSTVSLCCGHGSTERYITALHRVDDPQLICRGCAEVCRNKGTISSHDTAEHEGCVEPACQNPTSRRARYEDKCSIYEQPPFGSPSGSRASKAGRRSSNQDATQEELTSPVSAMRRCVWIGLGGLVACFIVTVAVYLVISRRRSPHHMDSPGRPPVKKDSSSDQCTPREELCKQETEHLNPTVVDGTCAPVMVPPVQPEARQELSPSLFLSEVMDDDPGAYMRSLHCDEIARIFRNAVTPMLQSHVTSGHLSEEASAELLERHVRETRDQADDWMGRWQRGVSDKLTLSDVWVTLLNMHKVALLQEVQGRGGKVSKGA